METDMPEPQTDPRPSDIDRPDTPQSDAPDPTVADGVRRQRQHIQDLTGEDPLRGGVAD
jgi:hypothetical protein